MPASFENSKVIKNDVKASLPRWRANEEALPSRWYCTLFKHDFDDYEKNAPLNTTPVPHMFQNSPSSNIRVNMCSFVIRNRALSASSYLINKPHSCSGHFTSSNCTFSEPGCKVCKFDSRCCQKHQYHPLNTTGVHSCHLTQYCNSLLSIENHTIVQWFSRQIHYMKKDDFLTFTKLANFGPRVHPRRFLLHLKRSHDRPRYLPQLSQTWLINSRFANASSHGY